MRIVIIDSNYCYFSACDVYDISDYLVQGSCSGQHLFLSVRKAVVRGKLNVK